MQRVVLNPCATKTALSAHLRSHGLMGPQVLLFTNKEQTPALFAAVAANVRDTGAAFAAVHERETEVLKNFKVSKVWVCTPQQSCPRNETQPSARLSIVRHELSHRQDTCTAHTTARPPVADDAFTIPDVLRITMC